MVDHLVRLQQHHVLGRIDQGFEELDPGDQLADVVLREGERGPSPRGRIKDDLPVADYDTPVLELRAGRSSTRRIQQLAVDSRIAFLDDPSPVDLAQRVGLRIEVLGHEGTGGKQEVCREEVTDHIGDAGGRGVDVVAHALERSAMPGVQVLLPRPLAELGRERCVVDQEASDGERPEVAEGSGPHEPH